VLPHTGTMAKVCQSFACKLQAGCCTSATPSLLWIEVCARLCCVGACRM
jgi:hypothetical protein